MASGKPLKRGAILIPKKVDPLTSKPGSAYESRYHFQESRWVNLIKVWIYYKVIEIKKITLSIQKKNRQWSCIQVCRKYNRTGEFLQILGHILDEHLDFSKCSKILAETASRALGGIISKFKMLKDCGHKTYTKLCCPYSIMLQRFGVMVNIQNVITSWTESCATF